MTELNLKEEKVDGFQGFGIKRPKDAAFDVYV